MNDTVQSHIARWRMNSLIAGAAGVVLSIVAFFLNREELLRSYLFADMFWTGMGLGCLGILLMHHTVGGKWGMIIRRLCEAGAMTIPFMLILLLPILFSMPTLYIWDRPEAIHDAVIQSKTGYLNVPFFIGRTIFYFAIWSLYAYLLSKWSAQQDQNNDEKLISKMRALSAPGLVVFTFTATFAFVDWIMSLEPDWFSTMYGAMFLTGEVLEAFALVIALAIVLARWQPIKQYITPQHVHDLGNMLLAFTVLWAYLAFSQFLIIWSGNLPDEIPWYVRRLGEDWGWVAVLLVIFHFCLPFLLLLQRDIKRRPNLLFQVCCLMLAVRMLDTYWIVEPSFYGNRVQFHWTDIITPIAVGGLWLALFFWQLAAHPLLPINDPRLQGAPRETVAF
jgi:hypothetical protein